jgi:hypothetical protein
VTKTKNGQVLFMIFDITLKTCLCFCVLTDNRSRVKSWNSSDGDDDNGNNKEDCDHA